jgi:hypothetical protein
MASITIRNLDDDVKTRLRMRAASHGPAVHPASPDNDELRPHASPRVPETVGVRGRSSACIVDYRRMPGVVLRGPVAVVRSRLPRGTATASGAGEAVTPPDRYGVAVGAPWATGPRGRGARRAGSRTRATQRTHSAMSSHGLMREM